jgi:hypothetical protein
MTTQSTTTTMIETMCKDLSNLGGVCKEYLPGTVAWNDGMRGLDEFGTLSCWGSNITDARIEAEDGEFMPYLKPENMNEKLGVTTADKISFVTKDGSNKTAQEVLENMKEYIMYVGYKNVDTKVATPEKLVVRVQSTFVPIKAGSKRKLVPAHYSYQTMDPNDPCNIILTGTPQGIFVHNDSVGVNKLYAHTIDEDSSVNNHWFEASPTDHSVGSIQIEKETPSGKAKPMNLGFEKMGATCNTFLVMSFQRDQIPKARLRGGGLSYDDDGGGPVYRSLGNDDYGVTSAARLSIDEKVVGKRQRTEFDAIRKSGTPIVLTILKYYAVESTSNFKVQPSDLAMAIGDMENIYKMCDVSGRLSDLPIMLKKLDKETMQVIKEKIATDPVKDPYSFTK